MLNQALFRRNDAASTALTQPAHSTPSQANRHPPTQPQTSGMRPKPKAKQATNHPQTTAIMRRVRSRTESARVLGLGAGRGVKLPSCFLGTNGRPRARPCGYRPLVGLDRAAICRCDRFRVTPSCSESLVGGETDTNSRLPAACCLLPAACCLLAPACACFLRPSAPSPPKGQTLPPHTQLTHPLEAPGRVVNCARAFILAFILHALPSLSSCDISLAPPLALR
jgi:hypothetical protein